MGQLATDVFVLCKVSNTVNPHHDAMNGFYEILFMKNACEIMRSKAGQETITEKFLTTQNWEL